MGTRRHLSIATKLPLGLAALLLVIMGAMTILVHREVRNAAIESASERLNGVSQLLSNMLSAQQRQRLVLMTRIADRPDVRAYVASRDAATAEALSAALQAPVTTASPVLTTEIWDSTGARVLMVGLEIPPLEPASAAALMETVQDSAPAALGMYWAGQDGMRYPMIARISEGGVVRGYLVERRLVQGSPREVRQLTELIGSEARLVLGNTAGDVWTDLSAQVDAPPAAAFGHEGITRYTRSTGEVVLARVLTIPATPWSLAVEFPEAPVLAQSQRVLSRAAVLSLLLVAAGAITGWFLSRRISTPLRQVTEAAEGIAAGGRAAPVPEGRTDEVGRLAASFNTMMARVEDARNHLEALVQRYRVLFDENPLPMCLYDREALTYIDVNGAAIEHYGYTREEFLQLTLFDLRLPGAARPSPEENGKTRITRHRKSDGSIIDVEVTRRHMDLDGRPVVLALANDVTTRLAAERGMRESRAELERLNAELERRVVERTAALEAANGELEAFTYSVSHDLRAPLRAVDGFAAVLEEDYAQELPAEAQRYLGMVRQSAQQMGQLIDDLLTFSRIGRQPISPTHVDMNDLARSVVDETRRQQQGRTLEVAIDDLPPAVGERSLLKQVLANYVQNAAKFTRNRMAPHIEIGHQSDNGENIYFVRDNGVGFDMRYVDKLFGVFQRLHSADEFEGTGVGLAIVQRIVQRHGGRVWAEAAVNDGATFYFTLPRDAEPAVEVENQNA